MDDCKFHHEKMFYIKAFLSAAIKSARKQNPSLTQRKIANKLRITESTLSRQLAPGGEDNPSLNSFCGLIEILRISPNEVFGYDDTSNIVLDVAGLTAEQIEFVRHIASKQIEFFKRGKIA